MRQQTELLAALLLDKPFTTAGWQSLAAEAGVRMRAQTSLVDGSAGATAFWALSCTGQLVE